MLKRPSSKRRSNTEEINLNLVPILDAMVTLISFLLFSGSFIAFAVIDSPTPLIKSTDEIIKEKKPPLNLTIRIQDKLILLEGGFGNIINVRIPSPVDGGYDLEMLHAKLIEIKTKYPDEKKIIMMPNPGVSYDNLVKIIDTTRKFEKTDPTLFQKNPQTGLNEPQTELFPEVIFGNILSMIHLQKGFFT